MNTCLELFENIMTSSNIPFHKLHFPFDIPSEFHLRIETGIIKEDVIFYQLKPLLLSFKKDCIYFFQDFLQCNYAAFYVSDTLLLAGPILTEEPSELYFEKLFLKYPSLKNYGTSLFQYYSHFTVIPSEHFFRNICITFGNALSETECSVIYTNHPNASDEIIPFDTFFQDEDPIYTYIQIMEEYTRLENNFLLTVATGNETHALEQLESLLKILSFSSDTNSNRIKSTKDYLLILHACIRKAAEKVSIHPAHIGKLSEQILLAANQCSSLEQLHTVFRNMVKIFCRMARENSKKSVSPLVHRVITYVQIDLTADLSLQAFGKRLNVNSSYLSSLFSKEMGMTLTEYVNLCRISHARTLLTDTSYGIHKIAVLSGFSDAKYFSRTFKKIVGMSPTEYRNTQYISNTPSS